MRPLVDAHEVGHDLLPELADQERGLAVQGTTAGGMDQATEQAAGQRRVKQHRVFTSFQLFGTEPPGRPLGGAPPDGVGSIEQGRIAVGGIPVVALHPLAVFLAGDHRARDIMARGRVAAHEAEAVGRDEMRLLGRHRRAFRILDQGTGGKRRLLAAAGDVNCRFHGQRPRMMQIQFRAIAGHQGGIGQPGTIVLGGEAGDLERCFNRVAQGLRRKIRGAGVALALPGIDGNADALVAIEFDGFNLVAAHRHRLPEALRDIDLASARALVAGVFEDILGQLLQGGVSVGKSGGISGHRVASERKEAGKSLS